MDKKRWILVGVVGGVVVLSAWAIWGKKGVTKEESEGPTPTMARPTIIFSSETGAAYISPTDSEYAEIKEIQDLRSKVPINDPRFTVDFSYQTNKFEVSMKSKNEAAVADFKDWLEGNGWGQISSKYFIVK